MKTKAKIKASIDMLHGPLLKKIILFALPIALCDILQSLFNSADVAVIGWFESRDAQAAVNSNGALIHLLIGLFTGLSVGVTVTIASRIGTQKTENVHSIVYTALIVAVICGLILSVIGISVAEFALSLMSTPANVIGLATLYLRIYFAGMPFFLLYNFTAAILRSVGDSSKPLICLLISGICNVLLNFFFVAVLHMSVAGVALATVLSQGVSAVLGFYFLLHSDPVLRPKKGISRFQTKYIKDILKIGLPAGLQGVVFSVSNVIIQSSINSFGEAAMAGSGDAAYFETYIYFFVNAFAQATVTFIGQNFAAKAYARCRRIFLLTMLCALTISTALSFVFTFGGKLFIRIYTQDEEVISFALIRMKYVLIWEMIPCFYELGGAALRGMKHAMLPTVFTIIGSCVFRILWIWTVFPMFSDNIAMLFIVYPITWAITGLAMLVAWFVLSGKAIRSVSKDTSPQNQTTES